MREENSMDTSLSFFQNLYAYDLWANQRAAASVTTVPNNDPRALEYLRHIVGAQRIWLSRFETPENPATSPRPSLSLDECRAAIADLHSRWTALLGTLTEQKLAGDLAYKNLKGAEFRTPVHEVLLHLVTHSVYHRGQLAAAVRESGGKPEPTDYIVYVRQRLP
jgi:uncharacterized damage-inducible protein DinB